MTALPRRASGREVWQRKLLPSGDLVGRLRLSGAIFRASASPALGPDLFWCIARHAVSPASPSEASARQQPPEHERKPACPPCTGSRAGEPFLAQREPVSPSMTVAAAAPRRPRNAHSSVFGRHISITEAAGWPSANNKRPDLTKGHAVTHSTRSSRCAVHFRPLAVGLITIRNGAAGLTGVVGLACATISG
jgi:hypothetical protein